MDAQFGNLWAKGDCYTTESEDIKLQLRRIYKDEVLMASKATKDYFRLAREELGAYSSSKNTFIT